MAIQTGTKRKFQRIHVNPDTKKTVTDLALKHKSLSFTSHIEGPDGRRNYTVDTYKISKEATAVRYEADVNLQIKVFQTLKSTGKEEEVVESQQGSFNDVNVQSNIDRRVKNSKVFKNYAKGLGSLVGAVTGVVALAVGGGSAIEAISNIAPTSSQFSADVGASQAVPNDGAISSEGNGGE